MVRSVTRLLVAAVFLMDAPRDAPVRRELLQSKVGAAEYSAAILRLSFRDPVRDAHTDLARGDRDIYCTGTIACSVPGWDSVALPEGVTVHGVASAGCIITGGETEQQYRQAETDYIRQYNRTKLEALRLRSHSTEAPDNNALKLTRSAMTLASAALAA
jgi:hypothetical protein